MARQIDMPMGKFVLLPNLICLTRSTLILYTLANALSIYTASYTDATLAWQLCAVPGLETCDGCLPFRFRPRRLGTSPTPSHAPPRSYKPGVGLPRISSLKLPERRKLADGPIHIPLRYMSLVSLCFHILYNDGNALSI